MRAPRMSMGAVLAVVLLTTTGIASADSWVGVDAAGTLTTHEATAAIDPALSIETSDLQGLRVSTHTAGLLLKPRENKSGRFVELTWPNARITGEIGAPALPVIRELFVVPADATVSLRVDAGTATVIDGKTAGMSLLAWPVQPPIEKVPGARERAAFVIDPRAYKSNGDVLAERATVRELGILRGQRLWQLEVYPVAYDPARQQVTFYRDIAVDVVFDGGTMPRDALSPTPGLGRVILNPEILPVAARRGAGNYLIVVANSLASAIVDFANAKSAQGFNVTTHAVADGTSASTIKSYIEGLWGGPGAPDYIMLVGDTQLIPEFTGGGAGSPDTDLPYGCMDGGDDWFPDIAIGRFPADDTDELAVMVGKTLYYENGLLADRDYLKRAAFMASVDNYDISEGTHNYVIDHYMSDPNEGWDVDMLYQVTYDATTQDVIDSFNSGRFWGIFSGHGGTYSWGDGPPLSQEQVLALTNENMYAYICSFACITGTYTVDECFMETWVLHPTGGAITAWGSSVNSYWTEDDILEKVLFDAIYDADQPEVAKEVGPIYNETRVRYLAHFGEGSTTRRYFEMYNLMGDPALPFPGNCSDAGAVAMDSAAYACESMIEVRVTDCGLNLDDDVIDEVTVDIDSTSETGVETVLLAETGPSSAAFVGTIMASTMNGVGVLLVAEGDTITATYADADTGEGTSAIVTATATVDCTGPAISDVQAIDIEPRTATIMFDCDEIARGVVHYGLSCDALTEEASGGFDLSPSIGLTDLQDNTTYYYRVDAYDQAGNLTEDFDCYEFTTPEIPDFFTEQFENGSDLEYTRLLFVPNGSFDYYVGCTEPITDFLVNPAGGTTITLTDDDYEHVDLIESVTLYGVSYDSIYISSNGYVTFSESDTDYTETLAEHFELPRVAACYDDIDPEDGGTISYQILVDRVVVTFDNVRERGSANVVSFQIELLLDGQIAISYLNVGISDFISGLSDGSGLSPDFFASDLSGMGACGPRPPKAASMEVVTAVGEAVTVVLIGSDDGLPDPPAELTYRVASLPANGTLTAGGVPVESVPFDLGTANEVVYTPTAWYGGPDSFTFLANDGGAPPDGGDSNVATVSITVGGPQPIHTFNFDEEPEWKVEGQWAFGTPTGEGGEYGSADPISGYTGDNVYGYNLAGDYPDEMSSTEYLTTSPLDCVGATEVELRFWRWLGVEHATYDHVYVEISNDGSTWLTIWENPSGYGHSIADSEWTQMIYDISDLADNQPTVYVRWGLGSTDGSVAYCGWNIDDVEIWGIVPVDMPGCPGDLDCNGMVDFDDIDPFVEALGCPAGEGWTHDCPWINGDCDGDENVTFDDIDPFVGMIGTSCP